METTYTEIRPTSFAERVRALFRDSLFEHEDSPRVAQAVMVDGIVMKVGFDPDRIAANKDKIIELGRELVHDGFLETSGGGWSFLRLPFDRNEQQWGEQRDAERLYLLCAAVGCAKFCSSRITWGIYPAGMPYIIFTFPEPTQ